jgi:hypothetical protein
MTTGYTNFNSNHFSNIISLQVLSPDCTNNVGNIIHGWDSMSSGYNLTVTFPTIEVTTEMKAVILGAAFLLVGNKQSNKRKLVGLQAIMVMSMKMAVFWDVAQCSLVYFNPCFQRLLTPPSG